MNLHYPYFKGLEADRYSFYRVPKALVKADPFQKMSGDAKLLYAVLLDRMRRHIVQHGPWATTKLLPTFWTRRMAAP